ncbi:hypothetical protein GW17_00004818 [Ensete ventricosum]|nr:hypothetical protein GW17_00004818 [Ensete ventricosum]
MTSQPSSPPEFSDYPHSHTYIISQWTPCGFHRATARGMAGRPRVLPLVPAFANHVPRSSQYWRQQSTKSAQHPSTPLIRRPGFVLSSIVGPLPFLNCPLLDYLPGKRTPADGTHKTTEGSSAHGSSRNELTATSRRKICA